jgi:NADP-dependent 3-hydroxy-3-methylglutaryl-CoA reductase
VLDAQRRLSVDPDALLEPHRVPARGRYDEMARRERLAWIRQRTDADLAALEEMRLVPDRLARNVENAIGAVEIPVGLAGPLLFCGEGVEGIVHAPLATTEGALVASACRGAMAISRAGGVTTHVHAQRMTRGPAFEFDMPAAAFRFAEWIGTQLEPLRACTREVSSHARLLGVEPVVIGRTVHVLFVYETGDAAGQNMTTATTWHACQWLLGQLRAQGSEPRRFLIEANLSSDKKVCLAALAGARRGWSVSAECTIDADTCRRILKTPPRALAEAHAIMRDGGAHVGMVGHNINVANVVAGIFVATGQDVACVHESSLGELTLEERDGTLHARLALPGLVVGTVGGGTHLPGQRAALRLLGCDGPGSARRLAEIIAGFGLALDLSTLAAVATGEFASAHERLGRNRPVAPLREDELDAAFFERGLRRRLDPTLRVHGVSPLASGEGASILTALTARRLGKCVGLLHRRVRHSHGATDVVVKVKPLDAEVLLMMQGVAAMCGQEVAEAHARYRGETGFAGCHVRELAIYTQTDPRFTAHVPAVYDIVRDDAREAFVLVLERLADVRLLDSADDPRGWGSAEIEAALRGIGAVHAIWMNREHELLAQPWIGVPPTAERMASMSPLWEALATHAAQELPALMTPAELERQLEVVRDIPRWWRRLEEMPRTLVHNDFNPRNVALRHDGGVLRLCAYDWELATIRPPQHDAAELLAYVLPPDAGADEVRHYVELHRRAVAEHGGVVPDEATWREGFALSLRDLLVNRFALYLMAHGFRHYGFLERSLRTLRRLIDLEPEIR